MKNNPDIVLILASSSPYRQQLLRRLDVEFQVFVPDIDESALADETPGQLALRLAENKARAVAANHRGNAVIIGSDQVAVLGSEILGKPGSHENATRQLMKSSGQAVNFLTAVAVLNTANGICRSELCEYSVVFRKLEPSEIENYLLHEQPYNCAGSFKSEGLGIVLLEKMQGDDPTSLIGLPLIRLSRMLSEAGIQLS